MLASILAMVNGGWCGCHVVGRPAHSGLGRISHEVVMLSLSWRVPVAVVVFLMVSVVYLVFGGGPLGGAVGEWDGS